MRPADLRQASGAYSTQWNWYLSLTIVVTLIYIVGLSVLTLGRYATFRTSAWDLGIYNQALYNTLFEGKFFRYTPELFANPAGYLFVAHFSPILLVLLPFYLIKPGPQTLLILQSVVLGGAALPLFGWAVKRTRSPLIGFGAALMFLANPFVLSINWYDFHPEAFLPLLIFAACYLRTTRQWTGYLVVVLMTLSVIEQAALLVGLLGISHILQYREQRTGFKEQLLEVLPVLLSGIWITGALFYMYSFPHAKGPTGYFSVVGSDLYRLPLTILTQPGKILTGLQYDWSAKLLYWVVALGSLGFLPALQISRLLPMVPWLAVSLLSNYPPFYSLGYQYSAFMIPFLIVAAVEGLARLSSKTMVKHSWTTYFVALGLTAAVGCGFLLSPLSPVWPRRSEVTVNGSFFDYGIPVVDDLDRLRWKFIESIPASSSVLATAHNFPPLSNRAKAYAIRPYTDLLFTEASYRQYLQTLLAIDPEYILLDFHEDPFASGEVTALLSSPPLLSRYRIYILEHGLALHKRGYRGQPTGVDGINPRWDLSLFLPRVQVYSGRSRLTPQGRGWESKGRRFVEVVEGERILFHPVAATEPTQIKLFFEKFQFSSASLTYALIIPSGTHSNGVRLAITARSRNGKEQVLFDRIVTPGIHVRRVEFDLSRLTGRSVEVVLISDSLGSTTYDWLTITFYMY